MRGDPADLDDARTNRIPEREADYLSPGELALGRHGRELPGRHRTDSCVPDSGGRLMITPKSSTGRDCRFDLAAIAVWNAANKRARDEYRVAPFASPDDNIAAGYHKPPTTSHAVYQARYRARKKARG